MLNYNLNFKYFNVLDIALMVIELKFKISVI